MVEVSLPVSLYEKALRIAERIAELQLSWPKEIILGADAVSMYDCFPYLFGQAFPSVDPDDLDRFALAARLYASSLFLHDKLFDQGPSRDANAHLAPVNSLRVLAMQWEAYRQLHRIFPADSFFWEDFRAYLSHFARACVEEQTFIAGGRPWSEFTQELALEIARGKNGVARATVAGLAALDGNRAPLEPLVQAIDGYNAARQMLDDLCDWAEDLEARAPSLLLALVLKEAPQSADGQEFSNLKAEVAREIFYGGHAEAVLELAVNLLEEASRAIAPWPELTWRKIHADLRNECVLLLADVKQIIQENLNRTQRQPAFRLRLPSPQNDWQKLAWQALEYIVEQWRLGFGEARHVMQFPRELAFGGPQYQRGDVFQRALIADTLCDVSELAGVDLQSVIEHEVQYLLSRRDGGRGGWRYFPELPELPADADDLAQIAQVLWRAGHRLEFEEHCSGPLTLVFADQNPGADGSFETWIIPGSGRTPAEEREAEFAEKMWGTGSDPEVMANLLYTLTLVNPDRYAPQIGRGVAYLLAQQTAEGCWSSTWYHGPYYGTYACLRLLCRVSPESEAVRLAADFLQRHQNPDGGWGNGSCSNPLDTSLALLGMASLRSDGPERCGDSDSVSAALTYLDRTASGDGGWPKCEFIRMDTGRAAGIQSQILSYGSRTVTTAFVLKAALLGGSQATSPRTAPAPHRD